MSVTKHGHIDPEADHEAVMKSIEQELWDIGKDLEGKALDYINRRNISVDGDIRDSITSLVTKVINGLRLEFGANARHAIYVHEGTKPHWPPVKPIRRWVRKKLNVPHNEVNSAAWFVRKKIAELGTEAKPFLGVPIRIMREQIPPRIQKAIARAT